MRSRLRKISRKAVAYILMLVMAFSTIGYNGVLNVSAEETTSESSYDYSWMDEYTDDAFYELSGLTKEEWKEEYPDLTFDDFFMDGGPSVYSVGDGGALVNIHQWDMQWGDYITASGTERLWSGSLGYAVDTSLNPSVHSFYIATDTTGSQTIAYCLQGSWRGPDKNGVDYPNQTYKSITDTWGREEGTRRVWAFESASKFMFGGALSDPNSDCYIKSYDGNGNPIYFTRNSEDGGTYGTYYTSTGVKRGLMIGGKVYEMTEHEARAFSGLVAHSIADHTSVTAISGKTSGNLYPAYEHLMGIASYSYLTQIYGWNPVSHIDSLDYVKPYQEFKWLIYNPQTKAWDNYTSNNKIDTKYEDANGEIKLRIDYKSKNICNNFTASSNTSRRTIKYNYSAFKVGDRTDFYNYFNVDENSDNSVPYTVTYDKIGATTETVRAGWNAPAMNTNVTSNLTKEYQADIFTQTAYVTIKADDLQGNNKLSITAGTETATTSTPYLNSDGVYASKIFCSDTYQDMALIAESGTTSLSSSVYLDMEANGYAYVTKKSTNPDVVDGTNYSLAGCTVSIYEGTYSTYNEAKNSGKHRFNLTTDATGKSPIKDIPVGNYTAIETNAPANFILDTTTVKNFSVTSSHTQSNPLVIEFSNSPTTTGIGVKKILSTNCFGDNPNYSLEGIKFEVRNSKNQVVGELTCDENGDTNIVTGLPYGTYTVKETFIPATSKGLELNTTPVTVVLNASASNPTIVEFKNEALNDPLAIEITKVDASGKPVTDISKVTANGKATLEGAKFKLTYYNEIFTNEDDIPATLDSYDRTWYIVTKYDEAQGKFVSSLSNTYLAPDETSDELFVADVTGEVILPYGTLTIEEVEGPYGYDKDSGKYSFTENGQITSVNDDIIVKTIPLTDDASITGTFTISRSNEELRTNLEFTKVEHTTNKGMEGVPFKITYTGENGYTESHIAVTGANGVLDTGAVKPSVNTNGNDNATPDANGLYGDLSETGIWFYGTDDRTVIANGVDDTKGSLPFGTYTIEELPSVNNKDKQLIAPVTVVISSDTKLDLGTWTNVPAPLITTMERDSETNSHLSIADDSVTIIDTVSYSWLTAGNTYTFFGVAMDKDTGKPLKDADGKYITGVSVKKMDSSYQTNKAEKCGTADVTFNFDATGFDGKKFVIFEYCYLGDVSARTLINADGSLGITDSKLLVAEHTSINDINQTGLFPYIYSEAYEESFASASGTKPNTALASGNVDIKDTVWYEGLAGSTNYTLKSELVYAESGEAFLDASGKAVVVETPFTSTDTGKGSLTVTFPTISANGLEGKSLVVLTRLYYNGNLYLSHDSLTNAKETIYFPSVQTQAKGIAGSQIAPANENITVTDDVILTNLLVGKKYEIRGSLVNKKTGTPIKDASGKDITSTLTFTATKSNDTKTLSFNLNTSKLQGESLVCYEELYLDGVLLGQHKNLNSNTQTLVIPNIQTSLVDGVSGLKKVNYDKDITLVDTVSYSNLVVGKEHKMYGTLMNKDTGKALTDAKGNPVTASATFTPTTANGTVKVTFKFDGTVAGLEKADGTYSSIVCFEQCYIVNGTTEVLMAIHENINSVSQAVDIPSIKTSLVDSDTGLKYSFYDNNITLVDTVSYSNLTVGKEHKMYGTLMNKDTGKALVDKDGKPVTASATFTPATENGTAKVTFKFDGTVSGIKKADGTYSSIVCFEQCYIVNTDGSEVLLATHENINSVSQTVNISGIQTSLVDNESGLKKVFYDKDITLVDTVSYSNLVVGKEHKIYGTLMNKDTRKALTDKDGKPVTASATFTPATSSGTVKVTFKFDGTVSGIKKTDGTYSSIVAFEKCYVVNADGTETLLATHENINSVSQTVDVPSIQTSLMDSELGIKLVNPDEDITLVDTVSYSNLTVGKKHIVYGTLMNKDTGKPLTDKDGKPVTASATFTPTTANGTVKVTFKFDGTVAGIEKLDGTYSSIVAFEKCYIVDGTTETLMANHENINSVSQTVNVGSIKTSVKTELQDSKIAPVNEEITIVDTVTYNNLVAGKTYTVSGVLMDKSTGKAFLDEKGNEIISSTTFTPAKENGTVDVTFKFNSSLLQGKTLVVYETLRYNSKDVCYHHSISDREQSFSFPRIMTTLVDEKLGEQTVVFGDTIFLVDSVAYYNFIEGAEYRMSGTLMNKDTEKPLTDKDGKPVTAETVFVADAKDGVVNVLFTFDLEASGIKIDDKNYSSIVAFEKCYIKDANGKEILFANHENINAVSQTVDVPTIETEVDTGLDDKHIAPANKEITVTDKVVCTNLIIGNEYTIEGTMMVKSTGEPLLDEEGNKVTSSLTFVAERRNDEKFLEFTFNSSLLQGETLVVFESLYRNDVEICQHTSLEDADQSFEIPDIHTSLNNPALEGKIVYVSEDIELVDTVTYKNLVVGNTYRMSGTLMNKETGKPLVDKNGNPVTAETVFVPEDKNGTIDVVFNFDGTVAGIEDENGDYAPIVCFEKCYLVKDNTGNTSTDTDATDTTEILFCKHENINSVTQTVFVPRGKTVASFSESDVEKNMDISQNEKTKVTVYDYVYYENLIVNKSYDLKGTLKTKGENGEAIDFLDANGKPITASTTFIAPASKGVATVVFEFEVDKSALGKTIVVFENCYYNENLVFSHTSINDSNQSLSFPKILTKVKGSKELSAFADVKVTDTVYYENINLLSGEYNKATNTDAISTNTDASIDGELITPADNKYTVVGTLYRTDGTKAVDKDGNYITAKTEFTPTSAKGEVEVVFKFNTTGFENTTLVVFEEVYNSDGVLIGSHCSLTDENQQFYVKDEPTTADFTWIMFIFLGLSVVGITGMIVYKRRKKKHFEIPLIEW